MTLQKQLENEQLQLNKISTRIDELETELSNLQTSSTDLDELEQIADQRAQATQRIKLLKEAREHQVDKVAEVEAQIKHESDIEVQRQKIETLKDRNKKLTRQRVKAEKALGQLVQELDVLRDLGVGMDAKMVIGSAWLKVCREVGVSPEVQYMMAWYGNSNPYRLSGDFMADPRETETPLTQADLTRQIVKAESDLNAMETSHV